MPVRSGPTHASGHFRGPGAGAMSLRPVTDRAIIEAAAAKQHLLRRLPTGLLFRRRAIVVLAQRPGHWYRLGLISTYGAAGCHFDHFASLVETTFGHHGLLCHLSGLSRLTQRAPLDTRPDRAHHRDRVSRPSNVKTRAVGFRVRCPCHVAEGGRARTNGIPHPAGS